MAFDKLLANCVIVGMITIAIGIFTERTLYRYDRKDNFLSKLKRNYLSFILILFLFGFLVHYIFDYIGLEAACEKKCVDDFCEYKCYVKVAGNKIIA